MRRPVKVLVTRLLVTLTLVTGTTYVAWRWLFSVNWENWWIAVPLVLAETYALVEAYLFGLTVWRIKVRGEPPAPPPDATVDVFITTYNEPAELVRATAVAARAIDHPHTTWILDDGDRAEVRTMAAEIGVGYVTRSADWVGRPRHAKAGNLNNALFETQGEFILILDADQVPDPRILDRTLGWFEDPRVALVQTPQWFSNVTDSDPLGSQAPLFYGPIQQGKDGWNAAFFCGSNAVLRREALMQLGIVGYVREVEVAVGEALRTARRILERTAKRLPDSPARTGVLAVRDAALDARRRLAAGDHIADVTYDFQRAVDAVSGELVATDMAGIKADLAELAELHSADDTGGVPIATDPDLGLPVVDEVALERLAERDVSPLAALEEVSRLVSAVELDRSGEAQPVMPLATLSVTEDMATCMRLHALGWRSVFHQEILAHGLAPEDLRTMLQQRLRWAQGTLQVLLKENPLTQRGLSWGQRLMYFATMWSYLSGFAAIPFLVAPIVYLCFGVLPVHAYGLTFVSFFLPYFLANQLLFLVIGYGVRTWRGQQYSLALFPLWIRACVTAAANVWLRRPLGFVVTPKTRPAGGSRFPARLIWPQLTVMALLATATAVGLTRLLVGAEDSGIGVLVNAVWVAYDLLVLSVIIQAALYRAPEPDDTVLGEEVRA
ncbi:cellulose synthase [Nocardioides aromaticivorans]|uniref:Cellulose synthase n=1 Tax=Nocardioides aromaticivorans TaxID=200618 RepID=A0ABX7PMT5_9ACTN|nr:glycosyltransferase family 2 protein [Nocardioides aromaticivorans]QSR27037.1 cellulose synthase [Nocardioides aromaticivorans]